MRPYPLNAWYAAAWDVEVGRELLARTICDQELVLYRQLAARRSRSRTPAGTAGCRCRAAGSTATRWSAATMVLHTT